MGKLKIVFSVFLDERFNFPFSGQITKDKANSRWFQIYIGFLFWTFSFLFVKK